MCEGRKRHYSLFFIRERSLLNVTLQFWKQFVATQQVLRIDHVLNVFMQDGADHINVPTKCFCFLDEYFTDGVIALEYPKCMVQSAGTGQGEDDVSYHGNSKKSENMPLPSTSRDEDDIFRLQGMCTSPKSVLFSGLWLFVEQVIDDDRKSYSADLDGR
ncbi:hypothetical protein AVEN_259951-1 [Araneus ventricosus]|uniref:Uncharacterized protein n=1 Tax=Araneus ventricosus TaxID=182803 RepID=A0A4Y2NR12_ARAVE|nr:hypothetical protein AVEN_259951-1 [Araneus ventricosus]